MGADARARAEQRLRRAQRYVGKPRECWCTGQCGGDPKRCTYLQKPPPATLAEAVEEVAAVAEVIDVREGANLRELYAELCAQTKTTPPAEADGAK